MKYFIILKLGIYPSITVVKIAKWPKQNAVVCTLFQDRIHGRMHSNMPSLICLLEKNLLP